MDELKRRQAGVLVEMHDANRLIAASQQNMALVREHLELVLQVLGNAGRLYRKASDEQRKWPNQAVFARIAVDLTGDDATTGEVIRELVIDLERNYQPLEKANGRTQK